MPDEKVFTNTVVEDAPFPGQEDVSNKTSVKTPKGTFNNKVSKEKGFPTPKVAIELLSSAFNTKTRKIQQEFKFNPSGAIQIGDYKKGVTGDMRISPAGLLARNKAGLTTVAIDGETGDAIFKGEIRTGAVVTGAVAVGPDGDIYIDGANKRMIFYNDNIPAIVIGNVD